MFGGIQLQGTPPKGIVMQTRAEKNIANHTGTQPTDQCRRIFAHLCETHPDWRVRAQPTGVYNCAGLVWAARRTAISEDATWLQIRDEDGYRELRQDQLPTVGDLIVYRESPRGKLLHVGLIVELRPVIVGGNPVVPWVLSKWSETSGEVLHHYNQTPYDTFNPPVSISFWSELPP